MKPVVLLNKPIYVGMAILDLSKLHMYKFYYDVLKTKYNDKIKLAYTDTDSFVIHVETEDLYKDLKKLVVIWIFQIIPKTMITTTTQIKKCWVNSKMKLTVKLFENGLV